MAGHGAGVLLRKIMFSSHWLDGKQVHKCRKQLGINETVMHDLRGIMQKLKV